MSTAMNTSSAMVRFGPSTILVFAPTERSLEFDWLSRRNAIPRLLPFHIPLDR